MRTLISLFLIGVFTGCSAPESVKTPTSDLDACPSFVLPNQFGFEWETVNHRVSLWAMKLLPTEPEGCWADKLEVGVIGGDFSTGERFTDNPTVHFGFQSVVQPDPTVLGASRVSLDFDLAPPGGVTRHMALSRLEHHLTGYAQIAAMIEGFSFQTDVEQGLDYPDNYNPAHGYTSRGLGMNVEVTDFTDSTIHLRVDVRFEHGTSDREAMNAAIPYANTAAHVDIVLLGLHQNIPVHEGGVDYDLTYPLPEPLSKDRFEPASDEQQSLLLEGSPGHGTGIFGWTQIDFRLAPAQEEDPEGTAGYYIRAFRAAIDQREYNPKTGSALFHLNGYASNSSEAWSYYGLHSHFIGKMIWAQVPDPPQPTVIEEAIETGLTIIDLPHEQP